MVWELTKDERVLASEGKLCPECKETENIVCIGSTPDHINMNYAYDCKCGCKWEGY